MLKRFLVFNLLLLAAGFASAQDMPPLPSDAPPSAVPAKDDTMPALPDAAPSTAPAIVAPVSSAAPSASNDMPALPDTGGPAPTASDVPALPAAASTAPADNSMPALPSAASTAPATSPAALNDMPALPNAGGAAPAATDSGMPALPDSSAPAMAPASNDMPALPGETKAVAAPAPVAAKVAVKHAPVKKPWTESKIRPETILGGWIQAKGGNITSRLSWASQQVLNVMDARKYKMANEEGVYEGEQNKGSQYRKFTFVVPRSKDTVFVLVETGWKKNVVKSGTR